MICQCCVSILLHCSQLSRKKRKRCRFYADFKAEGMFAPLFFLFHHLFKAPAQYFTWTPANCFLSQIQPNLSVSSSKAGSRLKLTTHWFLFRVQQTFVSLSHFFSTCCQRLLDIWCNASEHWTPATGIEHQQAPEARAVSPEDVCEFIKQ